MSRVDCEGVRKVQQEGVDMSAFVSMEREPSIGPADTNCAQQDEARRFKRIVGPDQEVWVKNQILTAITAAFLVVQAKKVRADSDVIMSGIEGIANGAAVEIIRTLDMEPGFVNLHRATIQHDSIRNAILI